MTHQNDSTQRHTSSSGEAHSLATQLEVVYQEGLRFEGSNAAGVSIVLDGGQPRETRGGFSPMDLVLVALAGCTAMDVISILHKKRLNVREYRVLVSGVRAEEHPRVYTHISLHHIVRGEVPVTDLQRAVDLSVEKYCSVHAMLAPKVEIATTLEVMVGG